MDSNHSTHTVPAGAQEPDDAVWRDAVVPTFDRREVIDRIATLAGHLGEMGGGPSASIDEPDSVEAPGSVVVVVARFDDVATIIEVLGAEALELLLDGAARRIVTALGPAGVVGRLGDGIVVARTADRRSVEQFADRARRAMLARVTRNGVAVAVGASVGAAIGTVEPVREHGLDGAGRLLGRAESATDAARDTGGRVVVVDEHHPLAVNDRLQLASALSQALDDDELGLEYQPIVATVSEDLCGIEALLRWDRPFHGRTVAADFVGVAETSGLMPTIGDWVLRRACADLRWLIDNTDVNPRLAVHVNVSDTQLTSTAVVGTAVDVMREHRLHPSQLVVEVREATLMRDRPAVERCVRALRRVGVRVAVDRFGTGPDPFALLSDVGADIVKLDRHLALPRLVETGEADNEIARAVVLLARSLGMQVVAERVDDVDQLRRLRAAGCDMVQGHLLGRPLPLADLAKLLGRDQLTS